jgi:hypothetical protein
LTAPAATGLAAVGSATEPAIDAVNATNSAEETKRNMFQPHSLETSLGANAPTSV